MAKVDDTVYLVKVTDTATNKSKYYESKRINGLGLKAANELADGVQKQFDGIDDNRFTVGVHKMSRKKYMVYKLKGYEHE